MDPEKLGDKVNCFCPALDPDLSEKDRQDPAIIKKRYDLLDETIQMLTDESITADELARNYIIYYNFYPTQDLMKKLIMRMTQVKNIQIDLWQGFHPITRSSGVIEYAPNENIEPYNI